MGMGMDLLVSTFDVESVVFSKRGLHFLVFYGALGWTCWRQLSMSKVWYSLSGAHTFWLSMGLEGDFGMGWLASCE